MSAKSSLFIFLSSFVLTSYTAAAPSTSQSRQSQVKNAQSLLQSSSAFCKAFLNGTVPYQSTVVLTKSITTTLPRSTQTITSTTSTIDRTVTSTVTNQVIATSTNINTQNSTISTTIATTSPIVATSTITYSSTQTSIETDTATTISFVSTATSFYPILTTTTIEQTSTATSTVTSSGTTTLDITSIVTSTTYPYVRRGLSLPTPIAKRDSTVIKPKSIQSIADDIITDACLLLLYGTISKAPTTSTQINTIISTLAPATVTATPVTIHQSTTVTLNVQTTSTSTIQQTTVLSTTASLTATNPLTSTSIVTSNIPLTLTSTTTLTALATDSTSIGTISTVTTIDFQQTTITATSTALSTITKIVTTSTTTVKSTPLTTGYLRIVSSVEPLYNNHLIGAEKTANIPIYATEGEAPVKWALNTVTGYISPFNQTDLIWTSESSLSLIKLNYATSLNNSLLGLICKSQDTISCSTSSGLDTFYQCHTGPASGVGSPIGFGPDNTPASCTTMTIAFVPAM